jgi:DNA-binding MarR family transcriptional regulator
VEKANADTALERATLRLINTVAYIATSRAHSRRLHAVTGIDLPPSDIRMLELLSGRDPVPTSVLAAELRIDLAQASRQATQLESSGHLTRSTDPVDRRRTLVGLSHTTAAHLDHWLLGWSKDYLAPVADWEPGDIEELTQWFALVLARFEEALPDRPRSKASERWQELVDPFEYDAVTRKFLSTVIGLVTWVSQSGGFGDLLEMIGAPIRQHAYFTLRVVARNGPMPVAGVAERLGIDPSQASKRLRQLTDLRLVDRAVDGFDRRSNLIRVSRKGSALLTKVDDIQLASFASLVGDVDELDRRHWATLSKAYADRMLRGRVGPDGGVQSGELTPR